MKPTKRKETAPQHIGNNAYITPTSIILIPEFDKDYSKRSRKQIRNEKNLKDNKHSGKLSIKAKSKLKTAVNWLIHAAEVKQVYVKKSKSFFSFKVNFITLTIPPQSKGLISSKQFQSCLNTWLTYARKYYSLHNYVWKVEAHKDNRLHIHITADTFIHYAKIRESWNRILHKNGLLDTFYSKHGHLNPNSTDVHSVQNIRNLSSYILKYMSKDAALTAQFKGRIWGTSRSLSSNIKCSALLENGCKKLHYEWMNIPDVEYKPIESKPDALGDTKKIADMYLIKEHHWQGGIQGCIKDAYNNRIKRIRSKSEHLQPKVFEIDFIGGQTVERANEYKQAPVIKEVIKPKTYTYSELFEPDIISHVYT